MNNQQINSIATSMISFSAFLATWAAIIYYFIEAFNFEGWILVTISEIYILLTLLFISWVMRKIK